MQRVAAHHVSIKTELSYSVDAEIATMIILLRVTLMLPAMEEHACEVSKLISTVQEILS